MAHLMIKDLVEGKELDRKEMGAIAGGLFNYTDIVGSALLNSPVNVAHNELYNINQKFTAQNATVNQNSLGLFGGSALSQAAVTQSA